MEKKKFLPVEIDIEIFGERDEVLMSEFNAGTGYNDNPWEDFN